MSLVAERIRTFSHLNAAEAAGKRGSVVKPGSTGVKSASAEDGATQVPASRTARTEMSLALRSEVPEFEILDADSSSDESAGKPALAPASAQAGGSGEQGPAPLCEEKLATLWGKLT